MFRFNQNLLNPPDLLRRHPDAAPDTSHLEIAFVQEAVDGPRRDGKIDGLLVDPEVALQGRQGDQSGSLASMFLIWSHKNL